MAVLTKKEILEKVKTGAVSFDPELDDFQIQPHSIDLRLGFTFYVAKTWEISAKGRTALSVDYLNNATNKNYFESITLSPGQYFDILPKEYIIGTTLENIHIKHGDLMGMLFPRSSFNRRGLSVDINGIIDAGYIGYLLIPIINNTTNQTVRLYPGERICQVVFEQLSSELTKKDIEEPTPHRASLRTRPKDLNVKPEMDAERKYILAGKIKDLKKDYTI